MRNTLTVAALLAAMTAGRSDAQRAIDIGHLAAPDVALRLVGGFAKIRVTGWQRDSISITGSLPKGARLEAYLGDNPKTPTRGAKMYVESADAQAPPGGTLELRVPVGARVYLKAGNTDVEAVDVAGELDINVLGGSVRVSGSPRVLRVESIDAGITVDGSPEWVRLKTAEGDITMRGGSPDAAFTTVSGVVRVSGGSFERAHFETVSGNVTFAGDPVRSAAINIDTHSGAIDIQAGLKLGVAIDALTNIGTIENLLTKQPAEAGRDGRGQQIAFELGKGGGRIVIRTYKGHIRLARR